MADELVYRLVLDGQDEQTGSGQSTPRGKRSQQEVDETTAAFAAARQRIERERQAEMSDMAYRAIKRGVGISKIEEEDHQAKLDKWEAENEARKEQIRKQQERQEEERNRQRIRAEEMQARDEDWYYRDQLRQQKEQEAEAEKQRMQRLRDEERQERDEDWLARDELRQRREREAAAEKERQEQARKQREADDTNPVVLAQRYLEMERIREQTRLQIEATKRGVSPEDVAREEAQAEQQKRTGQGIEYAGNVASNAMRGNAVGLAQNAMSAHPVTNAIGTAIGQVANAIKQNSADFRAVTQRLTPFSGTLAKAQAEENAKDIRFMIELAKEQGAQRSALEKERRSVQREQMKFGTFSEKMGLVLSKVDLAIGKLLDWLEKRLPGNPIDELKGKFDKAVDEFKQLEAAAGKQAPGRVAAGDIPLRPEFRAQRVNWQANPQGQLKIPMVKARGMDNAAMPGG
ncbi:MAG: hypothetical protein JNJ77_20060 [Planctomycetia bacterium]|nr:hypothetical protein [Planctomycetia bacterium]